MNDKKYAAIDLGTNTFHLLIAQPGQSASIKEVYRERQFVQLAEEGISTIGEAPYNRALNTLRHFRTMLDQYGVPVEQAKAFGTAALRTASNGPELIAAAKMETGIAIQTISGEEEARLIHKGVQLAVPDPEGRMLIMDIGGGSVEFIIAERGQVRWAQSFPIGVAVLYRDFHHTEPVSPKEEGQLRAFLDSQLRPLQEKLSQYPTPFLVGASGTFDVLEQYVGKRPERGFCSRIQRPVFAPFFQKVTGMTLEERYALPDIPDARAAMLSVALILVDEVLKMANTEQIIVSAFAMKEGMLSELMQDQDR